MTATPMIANSQMTLFVHTKRPQWGRAVMTREDDLGRYYQFEDGEVRHFAPTYELTLLARVELPAGEHDSVVTLLRAPKKLRASNKKKPASAKVAKEKPTFAQQLTTFLALFPLGFEDPAYIARERGDGVGNAKFREAASACAKSELSLERLDSLIAENNFSEVYQAAVRAVTATQVLLNRFDQIAFRKVPEEGHAAFALALVGLLRDEGSLEDRFDSMVSVLAAVSPSWTMVTACPALFDPTQHLFVQPSFMEQQAQILDLPFGAKGDLTGARYRAFLDVGSALRKQLVEAGFTPRDNLDLQCFVSKTLSKTALVAQKATAKAAAGTVV